MTDVRIGKSQVYASTLGLGANAVGGHNLYPDLSEEVGKEVIRTALNNGITLLDTAYSYGNGRSEELIGEVLQEAAFDRSRVILATKAAHDSQQPGKFNNSPKFLQQAVEHALQRLQTDYIDIFYIHFPDEMTPKNEAVAALQQLKEAGKIRAIGVSNFSLEQLKEANQDGYVDIVEDRFSLIHREHENDLFPYLKENKISFVPYYPLDSGLLTGKYDKETQFAPSDLRSKNPDFKGARFKAIITKVNQLEPIARDYDATIAQLVLAWYLKHPQIDVVIPGAKRPDQVAANAKAVDLQLTVEDFGKIDQLFK
ncbi:aldo/keto reductase [Enterococcus dongliensis]|uniref:Aldo/keto reductase n=1 Tax=Enterococcus dongliensis TaxID=2559925 RepID=A0AAP5NIT3_9ENTE|nr:aldo/keto reductase [Enterococcus dongliensis]MDT2596273.1 aldo/keto reductase [Enterococcus dongliensis]MDT2604314.1 aldo/keto reductase [Enterococcus dongliensis]MDT2634808.1 aldo/keto reductase [Enterococcus dongliensis]MDT2637895.1 aldo/keto reductase [Enterococcus dongliensis]MDT2642867.1 aldo/keto reductase [Enterococcus dongliensis]